MSRIHREPPGHRPWLIVIHRAATGRGHLVRDALAVLDGDQYVTCPGCQRLRPSDIEAWEPVAVVPEDVLAGADAALVSGQLAYWSGVVTGSAKELEYRLTGRSPRTEKEQEKSQREQEEDQWTRRV